MMFSIPNGLDLAVDLNHAIELEVRDDDDGEPCPMSVFRYYGWDGGYSVLVRECTPAEVAVIALHTARELHAEAERNRPMINVGRAIRRMMEST